MKKIICSYLLLNTNTIGYVWIIKVFLLIMLLTPFLINVNEKFKSSIWICFVILMSILLEVSCYILPILSKINRTVCIVYYEIIPFTLAYSIPFLFGLRFRNDSVKKELLILLFLVFFLCHIIFL